MTILTSPASIQIRRGTPADLPELVELVDRSFAEYQAHSQLSQELPHLFTPARAGDYWIAEWDGRMVATLGLYPYPVRVGPVVFHAAGVGQVATLPEARGQGLMSRLLQAVSQQADSYDFTWLYGDALRYGRYGWTPGGWTYRFTTSRRYLPTPPPHETIEVFDPQRHMARLQSVLARLPQVVQMPDDELCLCLCTRSGRQLSGAIAGRSLVLSRDGGEVVLIGDGDPAELAGLLSFLATGRQQIHVDCGPEPCALLRACLDHYEEMQVWPSASFRVGNLAAFLHKAARAAAAHLGSGWGELGLVNTTNGQSATLVCQGGEIVLEEGAGPGAYRLSHRQLSEVCFGLLPLDLLLPGLPADSPVRQVLPLRVFISELFTL
jgi:predicted N-acetyltransferase YhbS